MGTPPLSPSLVPDSSDSVRRATPDPDADGDAVESGKSFKAALARVEANRSRVRMALGVALVARLLLEFDLVTLVRHPENLLAQVPLIGLALLSYLIVLWFLAVRTRDRFGFGMALGIGVLQATFLLVMAGTQHGFKPAASWSQLVVAAAHLPMAFTAFRASTAYPPLDSKRPWIVGFVTALVFLAVPWVAPAVIDRMGW